MHSPVPRHSPDRGRVLGIDGRSGSGKSTLATALARQLGPEECTILRLEDLYAGWDGLERGISSALRLTQTWVHGEEQRYAPWDWHRQCPGDLLELPLRPLLIVEGVGALARGLRPFLTLGVWCEADVATRHERVTKRDGADSARHWSMWAAQEDAYVSRDRPHKWAQHTVSTPLTSAARQSFQDSVLRCLS